MRRLVLDQEALRDESVIGYLLASSLVRYSGYVLLRRNPRADEGHIRASLGC